jgi:hypothetical protein
MTGRPESGFFWVACGGALIQGSLYIATLFSLHPTVMVAASQLEFRPRTFRFTLDWMPPPAGSTMHDCGITSR